MAGLAQSLPESLLRPLHAQDDIIVLSQEIQALKLKLEAMQRDLDVQAENELNMLRLINELRKDREPQPMQRDRGEVLRALLIANNGKMLAKEARQRMHLSKQAFTNLLATIQDIESRPYHLDKRQMVLSLK
jgi:hypothetical protein